MIVMSPLYLVLAVLFLLLAAFGVVRLERRRWAAVRAFGDLDLLARSSLLPGARARGVRFVLLGFGFAAALISLARPQSPTGRPSVLSASGRDVLFLLDLSRSMNAQDVVPSRLVAAKQAARAIATGLPEDRIGLVVFGGSAFLDLPPTLDRSALELFLAAAGTNDIPDPGTNLERALAAGAAMLAEEDTSGFRMIVVFSDGEGLQGQPDSTIAVLRQRGIRVFAVGVGTPAGGAIPEREGDGRARFHRDAQGQIVITRLDEPELRRIASETGGAYVRWSSAASTDPLIAELATFERRRVASRVGGALAERFQWPLALALLALTVEPFLPERSRGRRR